MTERQRLPGSSGTAGCCSWCCCSRRSRSYVFIVTAGRFTVWPTWNTNYDLLAEGFRSGHLYLARAPDPALLAKANPFDPAGGRSGSGTPACYDGHYYLYWGPLPAVAIAIVKTVFRIRGTVGDQFPLFAVLHDLPGGGRAADRAPVAAAVRRHSVVADGAVHRRVRVGEPDAVPDRDARHLRGRDRGRSGVPGAGPAGRVRIASGGTTTGRAAGCWSPRGLSWGFAFACRASAILPAAIFAAVTALAVSPPASLAACLARAAAPGALDRRRRSRRSWRRTSRTTGCASTRGSTSASAASSRPCSSEPRPGTCSPTSTATCCARCTRRVASRSSARRRTWAAFRLPGHRARRLRGARAGGRADQRHAVGDAGGIRGRHGGGHVPAGRARAPAGRWTIVVSGPASGAASSSWSSAPSPACPRSLEFFASMRFLADVTGGLVLAGAWAACLLYARVRDQPWPGRIATAARRSGRRRAS